MANRRPPHRLAKEAAPHGLQQRVKQRDGYPGQAPALPLGLTLQAWVAAGGRHRASS
jgi:hypothetical protein